MKNENAKRDAYQRPEVTRLEKLTDITPEGVVGTMHDPYAV